MKHVLLTLSLVFCSVSALAVSDNQRPFDKFVGKYEIISKACEAYKALCEQTKVVEIVLTESDGKMQVYLWLKDGGSGVGYPLQQTYDWRDQNGFGVWGNYSSTSSGEARFTETRQFPYDYEMDTKILSLDAEAGVINVRHIVRISKQNFSTGTPVSARLQSDYRLRKVN